MATPWSKSIISSAGLKGNDMKGGLVETSMSSVASLSSIEKRSSCSDLQSSLNELLPAKVGSQSFCNASLFSSSMKSKD